MLQKPAWSKRRGKADWTEAESGKGDVVDAGGWEGQAEEVTRVMDTWSERGPGSPAFPGAMMQKPGRRTHDKVTFKVRASHPDSHRGFATVLHLSLPHTPEGEDRLAV